MTISAALLLAIAAVESNGNPQAIGDHGERGLLQVRAEVIEDCNRLQGAIYFHATDCFVPERAAAMFRIYVGHYATRARLGRTPTIEDMARIWHGGPEGHRKRHTLAYARRVRALVDEQQKRGAQLFPTITATHWAQMFARHRAGLEANPLTAQIAAAMFSAPQHN